MSNRSASALLDAALEVPFDPEEENRRQLALARSEPLPTGPLPDAQLNIAQEQTAELAANEIPMPGAIEPHVQAVMDQNGEPPLPVEDESLPPVVPPGAGRRSAAAMLQDVPEPGSGAGMPQAGAQAASRRSAAAMLADIPEEQPAANGLVGAVGNAIQRGLWLSEMGDEFDKAAPDGRRVVDIQGRMRGLPASAEYMAAMNDKLTPKESWMAFKAAPVKVMAELLGESMGAFIPQMIEKAPARVAIGAGAGAAAGAPTGIGAVPGLRMGAQAGFAQATGAASFTLEQAGGILEALEKAGVPMDDPQAMAQAVQDPERMQLAREFAAKKAVPIAMFDTGSALLAGRLLGGAKGLSRVQKIIRGGGEMLLQGLMGGGGEVAGQVAQTGGVNSWRSVAAETFAGFPQDAVEVGAGTIFNGKGGQPASAQNAPAASAQAQQAAPATVQAPQTDAPVVEDVFGGAEAEQPAARTVNFTVPDDTGTMPDADMGADVFAGVPRREQRTAGKAAPAVEAEQSADAPAENAIQSALRGALPTLELPVESLQLSEDVPNFKEGASKQTGVVEGERLEGAYNRLGTAPIVVWERTDGRKEIISGRHRWDLARRTGEKTIPSQVVREADGFTTQDALTLDAELNIRDGQGSVKDYANYFRTSQIDRGAATQRGLLSRAKGRSGFEIGRSGSADLYVAFANGAISADKAAAIAGAAPGNEAVQRAAMARSRTMTAPQLEGFTRVVAMRQQAAPDAVQQDLFGADDSALNEAEALAKAADAKARAIQDRITAARSAANLFGEQEMPFNLAGQTDQSSLTPAEQAQAAKDAAAQAEAEAAQGDLFGGKQRIRKKLTGEAGGIDASIIQDLADYGVRFYRAGMDYAAWAAKMVNEFGRGVARFLRDAWDRMVRAYHNSRFSDTTGAVGDVRPKARQLEEKAKRNEALSPEVRARLGSEYIPITLNAQAEGAKGWIAANGLDAAKLRMARLNDAGVTPTPLDFAIGIEAAGMLSAAGDHAGAAEIVGTMSRRATSLGQTISVLAMMARLTPEGIVLYGQDLTQRYISSLPDDAQARIRGLQAEVADLKATLDKLRLDMANHTLASGEHAGENLQTRLRRKQRAKVEAEMPPGTPGPAVTAEVRQRTQRMSRDMRAVLLSDATRAEAQNLISGILVEQGNMSPVEADAMAASVTKAFYEFLKGAKRKLVAERKAKAGPLRGKFGPLEERLRQGDVNDADMLAELSKLAGVPSMTPALARELQELARQYAKATDPDVKLVLGATIFEKAHSIVPVEFWSKVRGLAYLAMLFSPTTWIRNVLGNEIQWIANVGFDAARTWVMDPLMSVFTGERTTSGVHLGPRLKALATPISDVRRGYEWNKAQNPQANFRQNLRAGVHHLRMLSKLTTNNQYDIADIHSVGQRVFSSRLMRLLDGTLSVALGAGDRAFWMSQFKTSMAQLEDAARKNGEWTGQPTPEMIETAFAEAAYAIYQNPNLISKMMGGMRTALNVNKQFGLGTGLLAFTQVPGAIAMRGLVDWSPLGMINALYKGMRGILYAKTGGMVGGKFDQAGFNKAFVESVMGTGGMYAAGYFLYSLGIITASREDDPDLEAMRRASGMGAYRINLSALTRALLSGNWQTRQQPADGDLIMAYDWAQPVAITVAAGAELAAQMERSDRDGLKKGITERAKMAAISFAAGSKSLEELPLLSGLAAFARAWDTKVNKSDNKPTGVLNAIVETITKMPSMFVPQLVRKATQLQDNMQRETTAGDNVQQEFMSVLSNIPGVSTGLPIKFDTMGRAIERYQYGSNTFFNVMLNPALTTRFKSDPVLNEMGRLMNETGQTSMIPRKAKRSVSVNGQQMELNNEQLAAYQYYAGNLTMAYFTWRLASPAYARMSDEAKVKVLTNDLTDIHAAVRSAAFGHDVRRLTSKQRSIRNNLLTSPLGQSQPPR